MTASSSMCHLSLAEAHAAARTRGSLASGASCRSAAESDARTTSRFSK